MNREHMASVTMNAAFSQRLGSVRRGGRAWGLAAGCQGRRSLQVRDRWTEGAGRSAKFPGAAVTKYHKRGGFKQQTFIVS